MTKAATATRKAMRPVRKAETQGTATTRKATTPRLTLDEQVAAALDTYGSPDKAVKGIEDAYKAAETAATAVLAWSKIAAAWTKAGRSGRAFGVAVKGSAMTHGRLVDVGRLIDASRKGKGSRTLTPREAVKVANSKTRTAVDKIVGDMIAGRDPLDTKATRPGAVKPNAGQPRTGKATVTQVTPDQYGAVLALILANLDKVSKGTTAVEIARLAGEIQTKATARAAALAVRPGRKATATPAAMAG